MWKYIIAIIVLIGSVEGNKIRKMNMRMTVMEQRLSDNNIAIYELQDSIIGVNTTMNELKTLCTEEGRQDAEKENTKTIYATENNRLVNDLVHAFQDEKRWVRNEFSNIKRKTEKMAGNLNQHLREQIESLKQPVDDASFGKRIESLEKQLNANLPTEIDTLKHSIDDVVNTMGVRLDQTFQHLEKKIETMRTDFVNMQENMNKLGERLIALEHLEIQRVSATEETLTACPTPSGLEGADDKEAKPTFGPWLDRTSEKQSLPIIVVAPVVEIEVWLGGTFNITCEAVGIPIPEIVWRRFNGENIYTGDRITIESSEGRGQLTVTDARYEDQARYICEAVNYRGRIAALPDALVLVRTPSTPSPGRCVLKVIDPIELSDDDKRGIYFGALPNSRLEYDRLPSFIRLRSEISIDFKTTSPEGLVFYFADRRDTEHMMLIVVNGFVEFSYNCGTGIGKLRSSKTYNDGEWHTVVVRRVMKEGTMRIDQDLYGPVSSPGIYSSIGFRAPYYIGGIEYVGRIRKHVGNGTFGFTGCMANIKLNNMMLGQASRQNSTLSCSDLTEYGAYFYERGGYILFDDALLVGQDFDIMIDIRPRSMNGVIVADYGIMDDHVILQMVNGETWFTVGNVTAIQRSITLCDGEWHSINARKNNSGLTLTVDDIEPVVERAVYKRIYYESMTTSSIYMGGNPVTTSNGVHASGYYRGCMRTLYINTHQHHFASGRAIDDVRVGACPVK